MAGLLDAATLLGAAILVIAALWHVYWAAGGHIGLGSAIPEAGGRPLFLPSRTTTALVALVIGAVAGLYTTVAGGPLFSLGSFRPVVLALTALCGLVFLARAIGDFRHVGLFNRGGRTRFAVADRWVYSPLCLFLGVCGIATAMTRFV